VKAVASQTPPKYERKPVPTSFSRFEPRVRELLAEFPEMPATVLAERVGWDGSRSWFGENVARLRPQFRRPDPADRLTWAAGDAAQCDLWFPPSGIPLEDGSTPLLPVLVITAAHSRFTTGRMIPTRTTGDLLLGSWELIRGLGRVPRRLIWDNETGIGRGGKLAGGVAAFTGTLATTIVQLRPRDPESKGIVERRNGYFETSFMPGRAFASPADFNAQFTGWLEKANNHLRIPQRSHGAAAQAGRSGPIPPVGRVCAAGNRRGPTRADHPRAAAAGSSAPGDNGLRQLPPPRRASCSHPGMADARRTLPARAGQ
jgi:hypothetical protein